MKRIYMIDCPGIVPPNHDDTDEDLLLRGSVRVENVEYPAQYIEAVLRRVQPRHLQRTYELEGYKDGVEFLEMLCRKSGRLLKGGEADIDGAAKMVLNDWIRGKIPWFTPPPYKEGEKEASGPIKEDRAGFLGEMSKKRKRDGASTTTGSVAATTDASGAAQSEVDAEEDEEFGGFSDEDGEGLEVDGDEDVEVSDDDDDEEGGTLLEGEDDVVSEDEDEEDVEEEVAAISEALAKAKKRQKIE